MKKILLIFLIGIIAGLAFFYFYNRDTLGGKAIKLVKDYLKENNISVDDYKYIELKELNNNSLFGSCRNGSGVLVTHSKDQYQYDDYLMCKDYVSVVNEDSNKGHEGLEIIILNKDEEFVDIENEEINLLHDYDPVKIFYYTVNNKAVKRVVIYTQDKTKNVDGTDNNAYAKLTLTGGNQEVNYGKVYNDPGFTCTDDTDGNLTNKVKVLGKVDTNKIGEYVISYVIVNSKGNYSIAKRIVNVVKNQVKYDVDFIYNKESTKELTIKIKIDGIGYKSIKLPDGKTSTKKEIEYEITQNGNYVFEITDINDEVSKKELNISNIDDVKPTGTCEVLVTPIKAKFTVNAKDNDKVVKYDYIVNNNTVSKTENVFEYSGSYSKTNIPSVSVKIYDAANNTTSISCKVNTKFQLEQVKDINGYDCLEGFVCYKQKDYTRVKYQAVASGVGTIYSSGCLPTSMAILLSNTSARSKSGALYDPETLVEEVIYTEGKVWGFSNYNRVKYICEQLNFQVSEMYNAKRDVEILKTELRKGNLVVFNASKGCYTTGAHYMTIIGINEKDEIFISDPWSKTTQSMTKECTVNAWSSIEEWQRKGAINYFAVITKK